MAAHSATGYEQPRLICLLFLIFISADSFSLPFLPLYADSLIRASDYLPRSIALGAPISVFWLMVATAQLTTAQWEQGRDRRFLMVIAMGLSSVGLVGGWAADSVIQLTLARGVCGFGYGVIMILAQDYLLRSFGPKARTVASGIYISLFFSGYLIGTLAGSALAAEIGFATTLLVAGGISALTAVACLRLAAHIEPLPPQKLRPFVLLANRRLLVLVMFGAIPMRIVNGGVVYLLAPLYLATQGADQATIGQIVTIFALLLAATTVPWSRLIDRLRLPLGFTILGVVVTGCSMLAIPLGPNGLWSAALMLALLGTGQALGMSPQVTVLFRIAKQEVERFGQTSVVGFYRVCERVGLLVGPVLVSASIARFGFDMTLLLLAGMMFLAAIILSLAFIGPARQVPGAPPSPAIEERIP